MQFLEKIKSSIYNPSYYNEILNKPFSYSLRYFLSLAGLIALIATITFSFSALPKMNKFINEIGPSVLKYYPDNLEVMVKNGKVSTNVQEPYFVKMPAEFKNAGQGIENKSTNTSSDLSKLDNLAVIDTKSPLTMDLFRNYNTLFLLSYDSIAYYDNNAIKIQSLDKTFNGVVTKAKVSAALNEVKPFLKIIPLALLPIVLIFSFIGFIFGNLIYLIFGAFIIWLALKAMKRNLGYGKAYQIGLHAITLGVILEATIFYFYPSLEFPFFSTLLMLAIIWMNIKNFPIIDKVPPVPTETPTSVGKI